MILQTTRIRGILRGNGAGQPQIEDVILDQRIKPGDNVLTAGGDQIFPVMKTILIREDPAEQSAAA